MVCRVRGAFGTLMETHAESSQPAGSLKMKVGWPRYGAKPQKNAFVVFGWLDGWLFAAWSVLVLVIWLQSEVDGVIQTATNASWQTNRSGNTVVMGREGDNELGNILREFRYLWSCVVKSSTLICTRILLQGALSWSFSIFSVAQHFVCDNNPIVKRTRMFYTMQLIHTESSLIRHSLLKIFFLINDWITAHDNMIIVVSK